MRKEGWQRFWRIHNVWWKIVCKIKTCGYLVYKKAAIKAVMKTSIIQPTMTPIIAGDSPLAEPSFKKKYKQLLYTVQAIINIIH